MPVTPKRLPLIALCENLQLTPSLRRCSNVWIAHNTLSAIDHSRIGKL